MKLVLILLVLLMLAPEIGIAQPTINENEINAYIEGVHDGFALKSAQDNPASYNVWVQKYNDWLNSSLPADRARKEWLKFMTLPLTQGQTIPYRSNPFNSSSDLSKFGRQQVLAQPPSGLSKDLIEAEMADSIMRNF